MSSQRLLVSLTFRWVKIFAAAWILGGYGVAYFTGQVVEKTSFLSRTTHAALGVALLSSLYTWWALRAKINALPPSIRKLYRGILHAKLVAGVLLFMIPRTSPYFWFTAVAVGASGSVLRGFREEYLSYVTRAL